MTAKDPLIKYVGWTVVIFLGILLIFGKRHRNDHIVYSVPAPKKVIALTFDDGPHPIYTPRLLAILRKYRVQATFFMIGASMKKYPLVVQQVVAQGHSLGNHTYNHPLNLVRYSAFQITKEINDCESLIRGITGQRSFLFRPPRGRFNQRVVENSKKNGYQMILWSVCGDRHRIEYPRLMARYVIENIRPGDIILLHDGRFDSRWKDVEAARYIIKALLKKGYQFKTVPQLLGS